MGGHVNLEDIDASTEQRTLSRRTLAKGAVWAVPAIAAAPAAPVYACSPGEAPQNVNLMKNYSNCGTTLQFDSRAGVKYKIEYKRRTVSGTSISNDEDSIEYEATGSTSILLLNDAPYNLPGVYAVRISVVGCGDLPSSGWVQPSRPNPPTNVQGKWGPGFFELEYRVSWAAPSEGTVQVYEIEVYSNSSLSERKKHDFVAGSPKTFTYTWYRPAWHPRVRALICGVWSNWSDGQTSVDSLSDEELRSITEKSGATQGDSSKKQVTEDTVTQSKDQPSVKTQPQVEESTPAPEASPAAEVEAAVAPED